MHSTFKVQKRSSAKPDKRYSIIERTPRGKMTTVGHSASRPKAEASVKARLAGAHGWKPSRRKAR